MAEPGLLQANGVPPLKPAKSVPLSVRRIFTGLYTNRNILLEPGSRVESRFYGGRPDALWDGVNIEISTAGTLILRPGYSTVATLPQAAKDFFAWQQLGGTTALLVDTAAGVYTLSGSTVTSLFAKGTGAGQTIFQEVGASLYMADGVETKRWDGTNLSNLGVAAPTTAPTISYGSGTANTYQTTGWAWGYCFATSAPGSSGYYHCSTMSPASPQTGQRSSFNATVQGNGCADTTHFPCIQIYRTVDGGSTYLYETTIANPGPGLWTYVDTGMPDTQLNAYVVAPIAHLNDPPPAGLTGLAFWMGRLWGFVGNVLYYSSGPDCTNGDGNASWPPANNFTVPTAGVRLVPYPNGMFFFTQGDIYRPTGQCSPIGAALTGGAVFTCPRWQAGIGVSSYNAIDTYASYTYLFTNDNRLMVIDPTAGLIDLGFAVGDQWSTINPANVSIAFHSSSYRDQALFISDGAGNVWRCNPNQSPEGTPCWSTRAPISGGAGAIASLMVGPGNRQLWLGSGVNVLKRDWTSNADNGTPYSGYAVWGQIVLTDPGEIADVDFLSFDTKAIGQLAKFSVLPSEISGTFTQLLESVQDPPKLQPSTSLISRRFYLAQAGIPTVMRHLQLRIDFAADNAAHELLGYSIYGSRIPE